MKKIIVSLLLLIIPALFFAACENTIQNFWTETHSKAYELLHPTAEASDENKQIASILSTTQPLDLHGNPDFLEALQSVVEYTELEVYEDVLKSNMLFVSHYLEEIAFRPILVKDADMGRLAKQFEAFEQEIETLKQSTKDFIYAKNVFEIKTTRSDFVPRSPYGLQQLRDFKLAYLTLIQQTIAVQNKFAAVYLENYAPTFQSITEGQPLTAPAIKLANVLAKSLVAEAAFEMVLLQANGHPLHAKMETALLRIESTKMFTLEMLEIEDMVPADLETSYRVFIEVFASVKNEKEHLVGLLSEFDFAATLKLLAEQENNENFMPTLEQQKVQTILKFWANSVDVLNRAAFSNRR